MLKKIKKIVSPFIIERRGRGFPGDGTQRLRSEQIKSIQSFTSNKKFISHYPELVACNENAVQVASKVDVAKVLEEYALHTKDWLNYKDQHSSLTSWVSSVGEVWPKLHTAHKHIVDICKELNVSTICDAGAGAGVVTKYVYASSEKKDISLTCLEGSDAHINEMRENFNNSDIILPKINVPAKIVKGIIQNAPFADNTFDLVFTCTVIMHNSYIPAILAIAEITRISSKYVLYVEGYHVDGIPKVYQGKYDRLLVDYEKIHNLLGYKTIRKEFYQDPYSKEYDYIVYLAEKISY